MMLFTCQGMYSMAFPGSVIYPPVIISLHTMTLLKSTIEESAYDGAFIKHH